MSELFPAFLNYLGTLQYSSIVSKRAVEKYGSLQKNVVGTGPFKLKKYEHGLKGVFERFDDYWDKGKPYLDGLEFIVIRDESSRLAALRKELVHIAWVTDVMQADLLVKEKHLDIFLSPPIRRLLIWLQNSHPPFDNVKLRQAVSSAINRKEVIDIVTNGQGSLSTCIPPAAAPFVLKEKEIAKLPFYQQDLKLTKKLLKEAGYPDGFEFSCNVSPKSPDYIPSAEIIQSQLAKVNIKMKLVQMDWGTLQKHWRKGTYDAMLEAMMWRPDPDGYVHGFWHSKSKVNSAGMKDEKLDMLLDASSKEVDLNRRIKLWQEIQMHSAESQYALFIYAVPGRYEIVNKKVKGYIFLPHLSRINLRRTWLED